jgi:hypothetical protein
VFRYSIPVVIVIPAFLDLDLNLLIDKAIKLVLGGHLHKSRRYIVEKINGQNCPKVLEELSSDGYNETKPDKCRQNIFKLDEKEINITQYTFKCCLNGIIFKSEIIEQQKELNVDIEFLDTTILGRYGIRIVLENKGDETVYDIDWKISVTGGLLDLIKKDFSNRILILEPGNQIKLHTPRFFGIGIILIQVKLYVEEVGEIAEEICGRQKCFRTVI